MELTPLPSSSRAHHQAQSSFIVGFQNRSPDAATLRRIVLRVERLHHRHPPASGLAEASSLTGANSSLTALPSDGGGTENPRQPVNLGAVVNHHARVKVETATKRRPTASLARLYLSHSTFCC